MKMMKTKQKKTAKRRKLHKTRKANLVFDLLALRPSHSSKVRFRAIDNGQRKYSKKDAARKRNQKEWHSARQRSTDAVAD